MVKNHSTSTNLRFEEKLWRSAEKLRSNLDASEYRTVVLGLIFLKHISDLQGVRDSHQRALSVPPTARWEYLKNNIKELELGKLIDNAMEAIEQ
ncbi:MAG: type I restriction-modification system subunit M N-terminal domain-containing protein, partial [Candidatus Hodarchaeales archaeon]